MSATPHSHVAFIVTDPVQDYEESLEILGVYGSLPAAQLATARLRRHRRVSDYRYSEIEKRAGDDMLGVWRYTARDRWDPHAKWRWVELIYQPDRGEWVEPSHIQQSRRAP